MSWEHCLAIADAGGRVLLLSSQLVLLLLHVERFYNTLLLVLDGITATTGGGMSLPSVILFVFLVAGIVRTIFILRRVPRRMVLQSHSFGFSYGLILLLLLLLLVESILMSLLAECLNDALLLLLDGGMFNDMLLLDHHIHRMVRIAGWIVLDDLLRVVMMRAVIQSGNTDSIGSVCRNRFDHFQSRRLLLRCRSSSTRRCNSGRRLVVIVHLELMLRGRRGRRLDGLMLDDMLWDVEVVTVGHYSCCLMLGVLLPHLYKASRSGNNFASVERR